MTEFIQKNWVFLSKNPEIFFVFGVLCFGLGAKIVSWIDSKRIDVFQERLAAKDDQIDRLKNDIINLDEIPRLREQIAAMKSEWKNASEVDYSGIYKKASTSIDATAVIGPIDFFKSLFKSKIFTNLQDAQELAKKHKKPIFVIIYDSNHPTNSKLKYSSGYFLEYKTTRDLIERTFIIALLKSDSPGVAEFVPTDDPLENCRWIVFGKDCQILRSEGLYANSDEGLQRTKAVVREIESSANV